MGNPGGGGENPLKVRGLGRKVLSPKSCAISIALTLNKKPLNQARQIHFLASRQDTAIRKQVLGPAPRLTSV